MFLTVMIRKVVEMTKQMSQINLIIQCFFFVIIFGIPWNVDLLAKMYIFSLKLRFLIEIAGILKNQINFEEFQNEQT